MSDLLESPMFESSRRFSCFTPPKQRSLARKGYLNRPEGPTEAHSVNLVVRPFALPKARAQPFSSSGLSVLRGPVFRERSDHRQDREVALCSRANSVEPFHLRRTSFQGTVLSFELCCLQTSSANISYRTMVKWLAGGVHCRCFTLSTRLLKLQ